MLCGIARQWALVTAGDEKACNTMTVSWGAVGELWGVDTATVYIRPQRYTEQFIDSNDYFTVCFFPEELKQQIHGVCGSKSGRDTDKIAEAGITPVYDENAPYFEQAKLVLVCRRWQRANLSLHSSVIKALRISGIRKTIITIFTMVR